MDINSINRFKQTMSVRNPNDDAYLEQIAQYKESPYYDVLLKQNPYLVSNNAEFSPTFWQMLGESVGDFSARDSYYADLKSRSNQWLSDKLSQFRQQDYDSAQSQVERMRSAGLNPDLNGQVTAGSAAENDQPIQPVEWTKESSVQSIASSAMSFVTTLFSMAKGIQSLRQGSMDLVTQELGTNERARDFIISQIAGMSNFKNGDDFDNLSDVDLGELVLKAGSKNDWLGYSSGTRKYLKKFAGVYSRDIRSGKYPMAVEAVKSELRKRIAQNNHDAVAAASSPLYDEDFDEFWRKFSSIVGKAEYDVQMKDYQNRLETANYNTQYFHNRDAVGAAAADNSRDAAAKEAADSSKEINKMWNEIYNLCKNENAWYGTFGMILVNIFRSMSVSVGGVSIGK